MTVSSPPSRFSPTQVQAAAFAKALAHPARIQILQILAQHDQCVCGDIVDELPLAQSTVSQHLSELKKAGLIRGEISGPRVCYCLDRETIVLASQVLGSLFDELRTGPALDCC